MMKSGVLLITLALAQASWANTITDPYPGTVCADPSCDVIGSTAPSSFAGWTVGGARTDVQSVTVQQTSATATSATIQFDLLFNYDNGDATLAGFLTSDGVATMHPGDILLAPARLGGSFAYAIPLTSHNGLNAGFLYQNSTTPGAAIGTLTALQVLNDTTPGEVYRFSQPVWTDGTGLSAVGPLVSFSSVSNGAPEVHVTITETVDLSGQFFADLVAGNMGLTFSSATCGNDVLSGNITNLLGEGFGVPEPFSFSLMGGGLLAIGLFGRKRLRKAIDK